MANLRKNFAKNLVKNRRKCGYSQAKLAELVNVSTHHIAMIELTRNFPASELIERIAEALQIEICELFIDENRNKEDSLKKNLELEQLRKEIRSDMQELLAEFLKDKRK